MARTHVLAGGSVQAGIAAASPFATPARPSVRAGAGAVGGVAVPAVATGALLRASRSPATVGTLLLTLVPAEARRAPALAGDVVARRAVIAIAALLAVHAEGARRTGIGAHQALPQTPLSLKVA